MSISKVLGNLTYLQCFIISLAVAAVYFLLVFEKQNSLAQTDKFKRDAKKLRAVTKKVDQEIESLRRSKSSKSNIKAEYETLLVYFNPDFNSAEYVGLISQEARAAGLNIDLRSGRSVKSNTLEEVEVKATVKGTFSQVMKFISNISRLERNIKFVDAKITRQNSKDAENTQVKLVASLVGVKLVKEALIENQLKSQSNGNTPATSNNKGRQ